MSSDRSFVQVAAFIRLSHALSALIERSPDSMDPELLDRPFRLTPPPR
ncbi:MAG: hypothetical protein KC613_02755 [Myxococcales bacterium]|nr:hypothetical protein [Myxococcales bacterium]